MLNVNVYGPTELKSLPHIFESVYTKWNVGLNGYFVFVYVFGSNPPIGSGREWSATITTKHVIQTQTVTSLSSRPIMA